MFNVCARCGEYVVEKIVDAARSVAICPICGYEQPFLRQPLFVVTGASGAGKTAVCRIDATVTQSLRRTGERYPLGPCSCERRR